MFNTQTLVKRRGKLAYRHEMEIEVRHGLDLDAVAADIMRLADETLEELGIKQEGLGSQVRFLGSTYFGVKASVRIFVKDIQNRTAGMDAVMRAISRTDYLAGGLVDDMKVKVVGDLTSSDQPS